MSIRFNDTSLRIINPLTLLILGLVGQGIFESPFDQHMLFLILRNVFFVFLTFEVGRFFMLRVRHHYPLLHQTKKRLLISYVISFAIAFLIITLSTFINRLFITKPFNFFYESIINLVQCIWIGFQMVGPSETLYAYSLTAKNELEKNELMQANLQSQLASLKAQMNPHFLFNVLNTLTSLIRKDPEKAEDFAVEMGYVYRHMLKSQNEELISLSDELVFVRSYLHLLKTRFDDDIFIDIEIDTALMDCLLPSVTLQILIENAVKHNDFSNFNPLHITIKSEGKNKLIVRNNVQKKIKDVMSTGAGLSILITRFKLLNWDSITIAESKHYFQVCIPLKTSYAQKGVYY